MKPHVCETACSASGLGARGFVMKARRTEAGPTVFPILPHQSGRCKTFRTRQNWPFSCPPDDVKRTCKNRYRAGFDERKGSRLFLGGGGGGHGVTGGESFNSIQWFTRWTISQSQSGLFPSMVKTHKSLKCSIFLNSTSRNWVSGSQTSSNNDQPQREADNKGSEGFISLIARSEKRTWFTWKR